MIGTPKTSRAATRPCPRGAVWSPVGDLVPNGPGLLALDGAAGSGRDVARLTSEPQAVDR